MALQRAVRSDTMDKIKFENKGDSLKGYYIQTTEVTIDGKLVKKHIFKTQKGLAGVLGQADMYQQLKDNNCERSYVEVTFTGNAKKLKGGRTMKLYEVDFDLSNRWEGDVSTEDESDPGSEEETDIGSEDEDTVSFDSNATDRPTRPAKAAQPASAEAQAAVRNVLGKR